MKNNKERKNIKTDIKAIKDIKDIKVGDYIEGYEQYGQSGALEYDKKPTLKKHRIRIVVTDIEEKADGNTVYQGKVDDFLAGARRAYISTEFGEVRVIENEKPFTGKWWEKHLGKKESSVKENNKTVTKEETKEVKTEVAWRRPWKAMDLVKHFKGNIYMIIGLGVDTETEQEVVIYKRADGTGNVWVRPRAMFESEVDKNKYPDAKQKYRFELIETH